MKPLAMGAHAKVKWDFPGSVYARTCPVCRAAPWHWCQSPSGKRFGNTHPQRSEHYDGHGNAGRAKRAKNA